MIDSIYQPADPERTEAVFLRDGKEFEWFDPVYSIKEDEKAWHVEGAVSVYRVEKEPGVVMVVRSLEESDA